MIPHRAFFNRFMPGLAIVIAASTLLGACAETQFIAQTVKQVSKKSDAEKRTIFGKYKIGNPYQIKGVWYYPKENFEYDETGIGSWYGTKFHGRKTANGEIYDMNGLSAAHRELPLGTMIRVTHLGNGKSVTLKVNDRGPFIEGRILDLSLGAARKLEMIEAGVAKVMIEIVKPVD